MVSGRYRILLCGQTEGIVSHGMKHVVSLHTFHSRNNIGCRIAFRMAGVKTDTRRIREHIQCVEFGLAKVPYVCLKGLVFFPVLLPLSLNLGRVVNSFHF